MSDLISLVDGDTAAARRAYKFTAATAWTETDAAPDAATPVGYLLPENDDFVVVRAAITGGAVTGTGASLQIWRYDWISERWYKCTLRSVSEGDEVDVELRGSAKGLGVQCVDMDGATEISVWIGRNAAENAPR